MSTNWSGAERKSRAPISLLDPTETASEDTTQDAPEPVISAVPDKEATRPAQPSRDPAQAAAEEPSAEGEHGPLVSGRRSASVLRKENVNDQLPPATGWQAFLRAITFGLSLIHI